MKSCVHKQALIRDSGESQRSETVAGRSAVDKSLGRERDLGE